MKLLVATILTLLLPGAMVYGQTLYSNGALLVITNGGTVYVNGGVELAQVSTLANEGTLTATLNSSFPNPGDFKIGSSANVGGDGNYRIEQDWVNDGFFSSMASTVTLFGNLQQFITTNNAIATEFNNLILTGSGTGINRKKTLQGVNANIGNNGTLTLNDRELETQTNTMYVFNTSAAAITFNTVPGSEGFVSSLSPGMLSRATNAATPYIFPTGSSLGTLRFRPVELTPQTNFPSQYVARLNNSDATPAGFDRTETDGNICELNDLFFHSIERLVGTAPTDVKLFYIPASDGTWSGTAHWRNASSDWNDMGTTASATAGVFTTRTKAGWNFTNPGHPYILSAIRPEPPVLNCTDVCQNSNDVGFTATGTTPAYQWTFPSMASGLTGQGTNAVTVDWGQGTGEISVISVGANGCNSLPATCTPTLLPTPNVQFSYVDDVYTFNFTDETANSTSWIWSFGDGGTAIVSDPTHIYSAMDEFLVTLQVTNTDGCVGTGSQLVEIFQDIVVPNVITPNNDGVNDVFEIRTSGLKTYELTIVNRWGNPIFSTDDPNISWDAKSNGNLVDDGVYFYTLKAATSSKEFNFQGNVSVIKN